MGRFKHSLFAACLFGRLGLGRFRGDVIDGDIQYFLFVLADSQLQRNQHVVRDRLERTRYWGTVSMRITMDLPSPTFSLLPSPPALSARNQQRGAKANPMTCMPYSSDTDTPTPKRKQTSALHTRFRWLAGSQVSSALNKPSSSPHHTCLRRKSSRGPDVSTD